MRTGFIGSALLVGTGDDGTHGTAENQLFRHPCFIRPSIQGIAETIASLKRVVDARHVLMPELRGNHCSQPGGAAVDDGDDAGIGQRGKIFEWCADG